MSLKRANNPKPKPWPGEEEPSVKWAFLRLGDILAEIADDLEKKKAEIAGNTSGYKERVAESPLTLDGECRNGNKRNLQH